MMLKLRISNRAAACRYDKCSSRTRWSTWSLNSAAYRSRCFSRIPAIPLAWNAAIHLRRDETSTPCCSAINLSPPLPATYASTAASFVCCEYFSKLNPSVVSNFRGSVQSFVDTSILKRSAAIKVPRQDAYGDRNPRSHVRCPSSEPWHLAVNTCPPARRLLLGCSVCSRSSTRPQCWRKELQAPADSSTRRRSAPARAMRYDCDLYLLITSPKRTHVLPSNRANCTALIGA